ITDSGVETLVEGLSDPNCKLKQLRLHGCGLSPQACKHLTKALKESPKLQELDLSMNGIGNEGVQHLANGLRAPGCHLETLSVSRCGITHIGAGFLAKVLCSISQLFKLDLSMNCLRDQGVKEICGGMKNPYSHLKVLNLSQCSLTDDCCAELSVGLSSKENVVIDLDLSSNDLQDKGVKKLCMGMRAPHCKVEKLSLRSCGLSSKSVECLITALKSNPQHLAELHLMGNNLQDSSIRVLSDLTKNQKYTLTTIE
uniref:NACHT, LRR and PYD domains-containing protein 14-like n=1 Tax=Labrus bergylta TaxID=56723 RepID=A0A3Q3EW88_9LABR